MQHENPVEQELKSVGSDSPIMVEGVKVGETAEETKANERANREFWEKARGLLKAVLDDEERTIQHERGRT